MMDTEKVLHDTYPNLDLGKNQALALKVLKKLLHEDDFNDVMRRNQHLKGFAFLDELLNYFNFGYQVSGKSYNNIPAQGRLIIVANHPIGTLDGLALVKLIRSVRPDVRIVANRVLMHIEPLQSVFLPIDVLTEKGARKKVYQAMVDALEQEQALIIFPAGEVSRITPAGVRDGKWKSGFLKLAQKTRAPILPIHLQAKNSAVFYGASALYKPFGTLLLVREMFNKQHQEIRIKVGAPIPYDAYADSNLSKNNLSQKFCQHVVRLGKKNKPLIFATETTVSHPIDVKLLKKTLYQSQLLGETKDGKKIFLHYFRDDCPVMQEIARLRELTFRTVEEGTGKAMDLDKYDVYYAHLVLWDDLDLEIVGAYRIGEGGKIMASQGVQGFYTHSLFDLSEQFQTLLPNSIELGRSFVQPRSWAQRSLDYLWYGIGAYLRERPNIKYLFGPVSMSNAYPQPAKEVIIGFYQQQFGSTLSLAKAKQPFTLSEQTLEFAKTEFVGDYKTSFRILNSELKKLGVKVPTLYKQYVELCTDKGCHFIDFNIDPEFNNCIDSLIMVELDKITDKKRQRYIENPLAA